MLLGLMAIACCVLCIAYTVGCYFALKTRHAMMQFIAVHVVRKAIKEGASWTESDEAAYVQQWEQMSKLGFVQKAGIADPRLSTTPTVLH
jgi:hypothetical protein